MSGDATRDSYQTIEKAVFYKDLLSQINRYRAHNGLKTLAFDKKLTAIAKNHSVEMSKSRVLSHNNFDQRYDQSRHTSCVENIAKGYSNPKELFLAWKNSKGHDKNMLSKDIQIAGISMNGLYVTFFACNTQIKTHAVGQRVAYDDHKKD